VQPGSALLPVDAPARRCEHGEPGTSPLHALARCQTAARRAAHRAGELALDLYLNVPLGVLDLLASWRVLGNVGQRAPRSFDPAGAGLLAIGFAALALGLSFGQAWGWTSARLLTCLGVSVVALIAATVIGSILVPLRK
jgi:hypothetical protein